MAAFNENAGILPDAPAGIETTYAISAGDTFNGNLDHKFDEDWTGIELERGKTYRITLSGRGEAPEKAEDTILKLFDAGGNHILTNDDIDAENRVFDSRLTFTVLASDTCYISAGSYTSNPNTDNSGTYSILVEEIEAVTTIDGTITGTSRGNNLSGTDAGETIYGRAGNDYLYGRGGDDELHGGPGDDTLTGGAGADMLWGGSGDDKLDGGAGADVLHGGIGYDTFIFAPGHGEDTISGFRDGRDLINITAFGLSGFDDLDVSPDPDGVTIDLSKHGGGTIHLEGFNSAGLDAADFLF